MGWKIYAVAMTGYLAWTYAHLYRLGPEARDLLLDLPISLIALIGVFGHAFKRACISRTFWRWWLIVMVVWDLYYNIGSMLMQGGIDYHNVSPLDLAFSLAVIVPFYVALYLYGYRSDGLWNPSREPLANK